MGAGGGYFERLGEEPIRRDEHKAGAQGMSTRDEHKGGVQGRSTREELLGPVRGRREEEGVRYMSGGYYSISVWSAHPASLIGW